MVEVRTSQPFTSTPVPSPNPFISASEGSAIVQLVELGESTDESDLIKELASLLSTFSGSKNSRKIKGSCEQLMDECILVPLFQNESLCETFHIKMSLIIMK